MGFGHEELGYRGKNCEQRLRARYLGTFMGDVHFD